MSFAQSRALPRIEVPRIVRQFTPNWFTVTMGTGVLGLAVNQFGQPLLHRLGAGLWMANSLLFALFASLYAARWILCFDEASRVFRHSVMSMFLGAIPMGLATIVNGILAFGSPYLGTATVPLADTLWWLDAALSVLCGVAIPFLMFTRQDHAVEKMTAVWLLPIVASEVAAASGGLLVPHLPDAQGFTVLIASYVLWALSVPLALGILAILLLRLVVHSLPDKDMAASGWLALGPIGTGALGLLLLGNDAPRLFQAAGLGPVGQVAYGAGLLGGLVLWGYGLWWLALAALKTVYYARAGMPFNLGWWGFTFPLGVYSLATLALGRATHLGFFADAGALLVLCLAGFWAVVATRTALGAWRGVLFVCPCIAPRTPARFELDVV
jgi:C4-dicarboxylate transporter/malic acid transport protein